jgi:hypothetical protein
MSINFELAAAVRRVNAHYTRLPENGDRPLLAESWNGLEAEIDRYSAHGDIDSALLAIANWEASALRAVGAEVDRG